MAGTVAPFIHLPPPRRVPQWQLLRGVGILSQGHTEIDCLVVFPARIPSPDVNPSEFVALPCPKSECSLYSLFSTYRIVEYFRRNRWNYRCVDSVMSFIWHPNSSYFASRATIYFWDFLCYRDKSQQELVSSLLQRNVTLSTKGIDVVQNQRLHKEAKPVSATST